MIKKVVVSAAGQGTRMLALSENKSKHLIDVQNRPFLAYLLDNIIKAGYQEIILVVGFREDMIREFLKDYRFDIPKNKNQNQSKNQGQGEGQNNQMSNSIELDTKKYNIKIVNQFDVLGPKEKEYGTACPIKCVKDLVGNENFISLVGDNFYTTDDLKLMNIDDDYNYVAGIQNDHPEKFGVLITDNGLLKKIIEKPGREFWQSQKLLRPDKEFVGNLINTSLYKFTPEIFEKIFQIEKSPRGEYEITDAISLLAKEGKVKVKKINDFWMDFGKPDDIEQFSAFLKEKNTIL